MNKATQASALNSSLNNAASFEQCNDAKMSILSDTQFAAVTDYRLVPAAVTAWILALLCGGSSNFPSLITGVAGVGVCLCLITLWYLRPRGKHRQSWAGTWAGAGLIVCSIGVTIPLLAWQARVALEQDPVNYLSPIYAQVTGKIVADPTPLAQGGGYWFTVEVSEIKTVTVTASSRAQIQVQVQSAVGLRSGQQVLFQAALDPGKSAPIAAWAKVRGKVKIISQPEGMKGIIYNIRGAAHNLPAGIPSWAKALIPGLSVGDRSGLTAEQDQVMKTSSLAHLTAVSGTHMSIILGMVLAFGSGLERRWLSLLVGVFLLLFVVLVGPSSSVLRAGAMGGVLVMGLWSGRASSPISALSTAIIMLLYLDPWQSRSLGFALSVAATAAIIVLAPRLASRLSSYLPRLFAQALSVPVAAQTACLPLLLLVKGQISTTGVIANILVAPIIPIALLPSLLVVICGSWAPSLAHIFAWIASPGCWWIGTVAQFFADLPFSVIAWPDGSLGAVLAVIVITLVSYSWWRLAPLRRIRVFMVTWRSTPWS